MKPGLKFKCVICKGRHMATLDVEGRWHFYQHMRSGVMLEISAKFNRHYRKRVAKLFYQNMKQVVL